MQIYCFILTKMSELYKLLLNRKSSQCTQRINFEKYKDADPGYTEKRLAELEFARYRNLLKAIIN